jgi:transcriptional regulator with XRE-family HTH domain
MKRLTLKEARESKGLSQIQLADLTDMQQSDISALERGHNKQPRIATMNKLAQALGMTALLSVAGLVFEERSEP